MDYRTVDINTISEAEIEVLTGIIKQMPVGEQRTALETVERNASPYTPPSKFAVLYYKFGMPDSDFSEDEKVVEDMSYTNTAVEGQQITPDYSDVSAINDYTDSIDTRYSINEGGCCGGCGCGDNQECDTDCGDDCECK